MALTQQNPLTEVDYLAFEDASDVKYEYVNGEIVAMTGASWAHNLICVNISTSLNNQLMTECKYAASHAI